MKIIIAENSGICFGVRRALDLLNDSAKRAGETGKKAVMLGPLIHNPRVVEEYLAKGVETVEIDSVPVHSVVIVRSHGITLDVEEKLNGIEDLTVVDTTCPYVKRIHQLVEKKSLDGYFVIVMGDRDHSEVEGITSRIKGSYIVVPPSYSDSVETVLKDIVSKNKKIYAVAQTTSRPANYENLLKKIRKIMGSDKSCSFQTAQTICTATLRRQDSAGELAIRVDVMIVLGGNNSSNTEKLYQVVKDRNKNSFRVESPAGLKSEEIEIIRKSQTVGITAGASTPDEQIGEMKIFLESLNVKS